MIQGLSPIPLQELKTLSTPKQWDLECFLNSIASQTPVRGKVSVEHQGQALLITGNFQTIVTLTCDRCLKKFNQIHKAKNVNKEFIKS